MEDYKECTDCVHYEFCLSQEKYLIEHNRKDLIRRYGFGLHEVENCKFFKDRSRFVELPCEFIRKKDLIRQLGAQCAVNKIDLETAHNMINHLPYFRIEAEQALKEREGNG